MRSIKLLIAVFGLLVSSFAFAGQWKPLCIEGGRCNTSFSASPLLTSRGFLLNYQVNDYSSDKRVYKQILSTPEGITGPSTFNLASSDASSIELPDGEILTFDGLGFWSWHNFDDKPVRMYYGGNKHPDLWRGIAGPPGIIDGSLYIASYSQNSWLPQFYLSDDEGVTWYYNGVSLYVNSGRYNVFKNSEGTALWHISAPLWDDLYSLWESTDKGKTWVRVDDGSFPADTVRVVHDPRDPGRSYALTDHGLYLSLDRGVSWQETEFGEALRSLLFIERGAGHPRLVVIGTDTGVRMSTDEMVSWTDISSGLLAQPHSVTYGDGQLIASSESGYYSCELMDCFGAAQAMLPKEDRSLVDVVEFYHPDLNHYFITASEDEANAIDQGAAGPGWIRTGEQFIAWNLGGSSDIRSSVERSRVVDVCRFYGSLKPGPNSHFFTASASECKFLMDLRYMTPDGKPRWHFEGYAFTVPPVASSGPPCPDETIPVYRAYNNGFDLGIDSNHRYMTDPNLVDEMVEKGWIDEGIAFCSPNS